MLLLTTIGTLRSVPEKSDTIEIIRGGSRGDQSDHATKVKIGHKIGKL